MYINTYKTRRTVLLTHTVVQKFLQTHYYRYFSLFCIVFDAGVRLTWNVGMSNAVEQFVHWTEVVMEILFVCECAAKVYAAGA